MPDVSDMELLRDYDRQGSEEAFAELVRRHINLVYSVAFRHVGIAAHAEEITQAVFVILARKAAGLRPDTILEGWLHETTRLTALSFLRGERRRQFREQEAYMQSTLQESAEASAWNQLAPLLDEAMSRLGKKDRDAVMLRFFKDKNVREVAAALKVTEAAAQRRVLRAVEKLRRFFTKRGVVLPAAVLTAAISANSVQAAPAVLAKTATAVAITKGAAASGSTLTLIKGALKLMAWTKAKTAIIAGMGVLLAAGTATLAVNEFTPHKTPSDHPAEMKIRWQSGKTYAMRAEMVETVESKSSGQPQSFKQSVNLTQDYTLSVRKELDNGGRQLELEFTGETMDVSLGERKVSSFDSKQDSAQDGGVPMSAMLRKQLGTRFQFFTDADGQVEKVEGLEELMREIKNDRKTAGPGDIPTNVQRGHSKGICIVWGDDAQPAGDDGRSLAENKGFCQSGRRRGHRHGVHLQELGTTSRSQVHAHCGCGHHFSQTRCHGSKQSPTKHKREIFRRCLVRSGAWDGCGCRLRSEHYDGNHESGTNVTHSNNRKNPLYPGGRGIG